MIRSRAACEERKGNERKRKKKIPFSLQPSRELLASNQSRRFVHEEEESITYKGSPASARLTMLRREKKSETDICERRALRASARCYLSLKRQTGRFTRGRIRTTVILDCILLEAGWQTHWGIRGSRARRLSFPRSIKEHQTVSQDCSQLHEHLLPIPITRFSYIYTEACTPQDKLFPHSYLECKRQDDIHFGQGGFDIRPVLIQSRK